MARGVKAKTAEPVRRARKPVPPAKAAKVAVAMKPAAAAKPSVTSARALSKDALRAQVEKLDRANTALRTKNREANQRCQAVRGTDGRARGRGCPPPDATRRHVSGRAAR